MGIRPTSITVIGWLLIVRGAVTLLMSVATWDSPEVQHLMNENPLPLPVQYAMLLVGVAVALVSGAALLRGQNWARFLYVGWGSIAVVTGLLTSARATALLPGVVVFVIIAIFLFRPKANEYFGTAKS